jgi:DNA-binding NtrC family response regulator
MEKTLNILVLIVEDDKYMNEILCDLLNTNICGVESAYGALDAIDKITRDDKQYQLVVLDYNLGNLRGITGIDIYDIIKSKNEHIKAIMISAHANKEVIKKAMDKGINVFLEKPFLVTELLNSVHEMVDSIIVEGMMERKRTNNNYQKN